MQTLLCHSTAGSVPPGATQDAPGGRAALEYLDADTLWHLTHRRQTAAVRRRYQCPEPWGNEVWIEMTSWLPLLEAIAF
jgi:hypothetical protein